MTHSQASTASFCACREPLLWFGYRVSPQIPMWKPRSPPGGAMERRLTHQGTRVEMAVAGSWTQRVVASKGPSSSPVCYLDSVVSSSAPPCMRCPDGPPCFRPIAMELSSCGPLSRAKLSLFFLEGGFLRYPVAGLGTSQDV